MSYIRPLTLVHSSDSLLVRCIINCNCNNAVTILKQKQQMHTIIKLTAFLLVLMGF